MYFSFPSSVFVSKEQWICSAIPIRFKMMTGPRSVPLTIPCGCGILKWLDSSWEYLRITRIRGSLGCYSIDRYSRQFWDYFTIYMSKKWWRGCVAMIYPDPQKTSENMWAMSVLSYCPIVLANPFNNSLVDGAVRRFFIPSGNLT